jgi:single-strand DNA-binding protein
MNTISLIGNMAYDPELKQTQTEKSVTKFTIAVKDKFNRDKTDWIDCVAWGKTAELCAEYLKKGNKVGVVGRLSTRTYENKDGKNVKVYEVVVSDVTFLTSRQNREQSNDTDSENIPF